MLEKFGLLSELTQEQRQQVEQNCEQQFYPQGTVVFEEGEQTNEIYFLISGKVDLFKIEQESKNNLKFKEMFPGESFGEMSFIDGSPRSCSIIAAEDSEMYILHKQKLIENVSESQEIINTLGITITHQVNNYLRYLSDRHVATLQKQIDELKERTNFGYFFIFLLIVMFITAIVNACIQQFLSDSILTTKFFSWSFLIIGFGIPLGLAAWKTKLSPQEIGWTTKNFTKSAMDGLVFSIIGILITAVIAMIVDGFFPKQHLTENLRNMTLTFSSLPYFLHTYIQEALRAVTQISIQRFFADKSDLLAIAITALTFAMCHLHFGIIAILVTFVACMLFGLIYVRTYNLFGVSLFHFIMGFVVFKNLLSFQ